MGRHIIKKYRREKKFRYSDEELIADLKRVANLLNKQILTPSEYIKYKKYGRISIATIYRKFHSWNEALKRAGLQSSQRNKISKIALFENIDNVWKKLGHKPSWDEMFNKINKNSKYSDHPYRCNFDGSWRKALEAFRKWKKKNGKSI